VAVQRARSHILSADLTGTVRGIVDGDRACTLPSLSRDGRNIAFAAADPTHAADLHVLSRTEDGRWRQPRALSRLNPWLDAAGLEQPIAFTASSAGGRAIDAWLVPPRGPGRPVPGPIVLYVHGGPHSIFGYTFFFDMHMLSAHGYAVLYCNPRATRSYGDDFACCNLGHWAEGDAPDQFAALDYSMALGWVDPRRVGVMGLSYGGYMVNWLIGHSTRFRAAVSENGISNLLSAYGTSDGGWYFMPIELGAEPDEDPALYARLSPLGAVDQIEIPLLLMHCEEDTNCPIEQAEQLYIALKRRGKTVEMVRFAGEGHIMLLNGRPAARLMRRLQILRWFRAYL
jgi:dipeptidyl aminopeptidase/acylaminoacyl peptidase